MSGLGGMSGFCRIRVVSVEGKWFVEYRSGLGGKRVVWVVYEWFLWWVSGLRGI